MNRADKLREVRFSPYRKGYGPTFTLRTYDTGRRDSRGCTTVGYELRQHAGGKTTVLFAGEDFNGSPLHADDSDANVACLMGFLTLRPGDTDADYFDSYTPAQLDFCGEHADALACEVVSRFGEY